jgi:uncharacterized protein YceH (UPF0502 family)
MEPDAVEIRVLGCLIEKQRTTPDAYPLSLNSLRLACNQATNRTPVVDYDETVIRDALAHLYRRGWTRMASGHGSRAAKYRHLLDEALGLADTEISVLAMLMLRGAQTPGELKQRTERLHGFADLGAVQASLEGLIGRDLVARLARQPGQKEERYVQLLGGAGEEGRAVGAAPAPAAPTSAPPTPSTAPAASAPTASASAPAAAAAADDDDRIARLEREVGELRAELSALRADLGA